MEERWRDPEKPIRKKLAAPVEAYGNWIESETVEEVKSRLKRDLCALYMEGLTIRERLLGSTFVDIPRSVIYRGAVYADASRFDRCVPLWLHALRLKQKIGSPIDMDLRRFAQVFSQILHVGKDIEFSEIGEVLKAARVEIQQNMDKLDEGVEDPLVVEEDLKDTMNTFLYLIVIFTKIKKTNSCNDRFEAMKTIYQVVHDFAGLHAIVSLLIESGAHVDVVNVDGNTPFECAATTVAQIILKTQQKMSLKCLAAQSVKRHKLTYQGHVPVQLEKFIELHGL